MTYISYNYKAMVFEICSKKKIEIPKYHDSCQIYHSFAHSLNNSHI